jgi:hypothetical protein
MDVLKMLAELRAERQHVEEAIFVLERLAVGSRGKRRGRPPKWMTAAKTPDTATESPKRTRTFSAAARKRMAESQRKRWAAKKADAKEAAS